MDHVREGLHNNCDIFPIDLEMTRSRKFVQTHNTISSAANTRKRV